jgi:hypothetical protein
MDPYKLAATLDQPAGFAAVMSGMFKGGKAKKAHAIYSTAQEKGVYETTELRFATHDSFGYTIMAFSTKGPLELGVRETLARQADRFPLGTIRYESMSYSTLQPWGWHPRSYDPSENTIATIGEPYPGVLVYTAVVGTKGSDRPLVIHARKDGKDYIYPVPGKALRG